MSLLPLPYLNTVVSIEIKNVDTYESVATGFLVGFRTGAKNERGEDLFHVMLVTNQHVFRDEKEVWFRFNQAVTSKRYHVPLLDSAGKQIWASHSDKNVDVAIIPINVDVLQHDGVTFSFFSEDLIASTDRMKELGISQGDEIFVLGFPMGIAGKEKNYAIVRHGIIARLDDEILGDKKFLVDSLVFPGNSGGPVVLKPNVFSIEGTPAVNTAFLLGIVSAYIPYEETAYSLQTTPPTPRIKFIENSGLASVVPMDYVKTLYKMALRNVTTEKLNQSEAMAKEEDNVRTVSRKD
jgi:hypothetical protein